MDSYDDDGSDYEDDGEYYDDIDDGFDDEEGDFIDDDEDMDMDEDEFIDEDLGEDDYSDEDEEDLYEDDEVEGDDYFYGDEDDEDFGPGMGKGIMDCWLPQYEGQEIEDEDEEFWNDEFDEGEFFDDDAEDDDVDWEDFEEDEDDSDFEFDNEVDLDELNNGDYEWVEIDDQEDPEFIASNVIEFLINPGKREMNYPLQEEDYDPKYDLDGDDREWNNDYMGHIKTRVRNQNVTHNQISSGADFGKLKGQVQGAGSSFKDKHFPPNKKSLLGHGHELGLPNFHEVSQETGQLRWARPFQIFKKQFQVIKKIDPHGINQGSLGDCYFLCAVSAVAEWRDRIRRLIVSKDPNREGVYCVTLCLNGLWQDIIIDDFFPVYPDSKEFCYTNTNHPEIWVPLLEKAWAKAHGGYLNIDGGYITEAVHDLTGAPCANFFSDEGTPEAHWRRILEGERKNFIMGCATDDIADKGNDDQDEGTGLCGLHAYSLLAAYELTQDGSGYRVKRPSEPKDPSSVRLVKIRNPWGKGEWKGEWSDNDPRWTPQLLKEVGHRKADDGIFFMPLTEFLKYYGNYSMCYYHDNYVYSAQQYTSKPSKDTTIKFRVEQAGEYYFSIHQVNARFFKKSDNYVYTNIKLIVSKVNPQTGKNDYVGMAQECDKEMWFKAKCQPGEYIAVVQAKWKRKVNQFVFSTYGPGNIKLGDTQETKVPDSFIEDMLLQKAKANPNKFLNFGAKGYPSIKYRVEHANDGYGYFYFKNESSDVTFNATVNLTSFKGCKLLPPYSGNRPQVTVLPQGETLVAYKINDRTSQVKFKMITSFKRGLQGMINDALTKGIRYDRLLNNSMNVGINAYILHHKQGIFYYYENKSNQYQLRESLTFQLSNARIESVKGANVNIVLKPGEKYTINVLAINQDQPFNVQISQCRFNVENAVAYPWA